MGTFTTNLKLGQKAFGVEGQLDARVRELTVGQIRITQTLPELCRFDDDVVYKEECMCVETGVGSGTIWAYGKNIFATEADAQHGVIAQHQRAHKQRAEREAMRAKEAERVRILELAELERLQSKYGAAA